jgi:chemotaxis protein MotB
MGTFGRMPGGEDANVDPGMLSNPELEVSQSELDELANHLSKILDRENLGGEVDVFLREDDVVIRLEGKTLFAEGSDELLPAGAALISEVYQIVAQSSRALSIEGHTDDGSTAMSAHGTHWMFAAARAARVHDAFLDMGLDPTRLTVASLGRTRPRMPNETAYQRSLNRRVEIVVEEGAHDPAFRPRTRIVDFNGIPVEVPIDDSDAEPAAQSRGA